MYAWAEKQDAAAEKETDKLVLIAGHTHRPVFLSLDHEEQLAIAVRWLRRQSPVRQDDLGPKEQLAGKLALHAIQSLVEKSGEDPKEQLAAASAKLEWVRAQERQKPQVKDKIIPKTPCYFNTGCGCYSDGDVTGIEIANGEISLIRFPDDAGEPAPKKLIKAPLEEIFKACTPEGV
jgi:hypothetical protein